MWNWKVNPRSFWFPLSEVIARFLTEPSLETYRALRQAVLTSPAYQPASDLLDRFADCLEAKDIQAAEECLEQLFPTFLVSPRAHVDYGYLLGMKGDTKGQQLEYYFAHQLGEFLMQSGDGSAQRPYQISCVDDELYFAHRLKTRVRGLSCRWHEGRLQDVLHTETGDLHFDIHDLIRAYPL